MQQTKKKPRGRPPKIQSKQCTKCRKFKPPTTINFYLSKNIDLHPDGRFSMCSVCVKEVIDVHNIDSVRDMLIQMNRPLLLKQWTSSLKEAEKTGKHVFGCYIKNLNLNFETLTYKDSEDGILPILVKPTQQPTNDHVGDEKSYSPKWMGDYTQIDIEYLEDYYTGLDRDFKIITTNHKDYAKKICKASLHMDKCFQEVLNNVAGADAKYKSSRETFDTLSKSAQFSESQRGQNDAGLGCFGVTFDQVEQNQWIPKHIPVEPDEIDKLLQQFGSIKESV